MSQQHEVHVPELGESVVEATVGRWHKATGDRVAVGDILVELETDKVNLEVGADVAGTLARIEAEEGADVAIGDLLAVVEAERQGEGEKEPDTEDDDAEDDDAGADGAEHDPTDDPERAAAEDGTADPERDGGPEATPVARRMAAEHGLDLADVKGSGAAGRVRRVDVERALEARADDGGTSADGPREAGAANAGDSDAAASDDAPRERREKMSRRRRTIARRLVEAQRTAAMLTTFNDVDMSAVKRLRAEQGESFHERHGVKLGFMSFFVKAAVAALQEFPTLNAEIDGEEVVYKAHYDIGMAIGHEEGLIVPVIRDADALGFAAIEQRIAEFVQQARDGSLSMADLQGGTFTITNGGVFGSLLSTPILNPPQVAILGLHRIEDRPTVVEGELAVRPMMYLALSYDHRLVDGREAVQFLSRIKALIEQPAAMLLA